MKRYGLSKIFIIFLLGGLIIPFVHCGSNQESSEKESFYESSRLLPQSEAVAELDRLKNALLRIHPGIKADSAQLITFLDSLKGGITDDITDVAYFRLLRLAIDRVACSHTYVQFPESLRDHLNNYNGWIFLPVDVSYSAGKYLLNEDDSTLNNAELLAIDGKSISQLYNDLRKYYSCDHNNPAIDSQKLEVDFYFKYFLEYQGKDFSYTGHQTTPEFILTLRKNGITFNDTVRGRSFSVNSIQELSVFDEFRSKPNYQLKVDDKNKSAILTIGSFSISGKEKEAFEDFIDNTFSLLKLKGNIKNLIIDLRDNEGGFNELMLKLASYTLGEQFVSNINAYSKSKAPHDLLPNVYGHNVNTSSIEKNLSEYDSLSPLLYTARQSWFDVYSPHNNSFKGRIFILTNHNTASAATYFTALHHDRKRATIVGEETEGFYVGCDAFNQVEVPLFKESLFQVIIPIIHLDYDIRGNRYLPGRGVIPDHIVSLTLEDVEAGKDTQLNFVLNKIFKDQAAKGWPRKK